MASRRFFRVRIGRAAKSELAYLATIGPGGWANTISRALKKSGSLAEFVHRTGSPLTVNPAVNAVGRR